MWQNRQACVLVLYFLLLGGIPQCEHTTAHVHLLCYQYLLKMDKMVIHIVKWRGNIFSFLKGKQKWRLYFVRSFQKVSERLLPSDYEWAGNSKLGHIASNHVHTGSCQVFKFYFLVLANLVIINLLDFCFSVMTADAGTFSTYFPSSVSVFGKFSI